MAETRTPKWAPWFGGFIIVALCVSNLLLFRQNLEFRAELSKRAAMDATTDSLKPGDIVSSVSATDLTGNARELKYQSGKRHLIFFLSPKCRYCGPQAPLWRDVLNSIDVTRFDVVGFVGVKEDKQAVSAHIDEFGYSKTKTPLPILFFNDDSLSSYKLVGTPTTLLIDDTGKVEHAWIGLWDDEIVAQVKKALK